MQVKILKSIASDTFAFHPGQVTSIEADLAQRWQSSGICSIVPEEKAPEPEDVDITNHSPETVIVPKRTKK